MGRTLGYTPAGRSRGHRVMGPGEGGQGLLGEVWSRASGGTRKWAWKGLGGRRSLALIWTCSWKWVSNTLVLAQLSFDGTCVFSLAGGTCCCHTLNRKPRLEQTLTSQG